MGWLEYLSNGLRRTIPEDRLARSQISGDLRKRLRNLQPYLKSHWSGLTIGGVIVIAATLISLPQPLVYAYLIDNVILAGRLDRLWWVILILGGIKIAAISSNALQEFYFARFEQEMILEIQGDLVGRALHFPKAFFDDKETGYLMQRLTGDIQGLRWFFSSTLVSIISSLVSLIGGIVMLFYLEWRLALIALMATPALAWIVRYFFSKAFATEAQSTGRVIGALRSVRDLALEQTVVNWLARQAMVFVPDISRAVVLVIGAIWIIQGRWQLGQLLAFQSYLGYVYEPALRLAAQSLQFQSSLTALERVSALFEILPEENLGEGIPVEQLIGEVEFREVTFSYNGIDPILEEFSVKIAPGEQVAIVGPSGVGKTTLISLIMRFYKPTKGEIYFDNKPACEYELGALRKRIGYVSQSPLMLTGTLMENLRYGSPEASQEKVILAAKTAGIHDFIASLSQGYDAPVGERGVNLSEGQKQRLSLARALIKEPDILILDEPTASLDSLVERSIFEALPKITHGKTIFLVAHRLATVQNADRILLLNEKRLVDIGTHAELMKRSDYYRSLVDSQYLELE
jgi:ABC-type multidrug transport system fused ATPase/permease subunit